MISRNLVFPLFLLLIVFVACQDKNNKSNTPLQASFTSYPVKVGNLWNYDRFITFLNYDSLPALIPDTVFNTVNLEVTQKVTLMDTIQTYEFMEYIVEDNITSYLYSNNTADGFMSYAYMGGGMLSVPFKQKISFAYRGLKFNSINELLSLFSDSQTKYDSLFYETPPVYSLKYPLEIGQQWAFKSVIDLGDLDKVVLSKEEVSVQAGNFDCYKIQRRWYFDNDSVWDSDLLLYDYIASEGLIKRECYFFNMVVMDAEGNILGTFDSQDMLELVSYDVAP